MKTTVTGKMLFGLILVLLLGVFPLYGADERNTPIEVNLIVDGSGALANVLDEVSRWISGDLVDQRLREGDRITIWKAGEQAEIVYSEALKNDADKEHIKNTLRSLSSHGSAADFTGALRAAASRNSGAITYTLLVSASPAALSPILRDSQANLVRFSRIEEFRGWRAMVIALNIEGRVRQAAAAYFSGT